MQKTLAELAKIVQGEVSGDERIVIRGFNGIENAKEGDLTFVSNPKYLPMVEHSKASAIIASRTLKINYKNVLYVNNPSMAFNQIISLFAKEQAVKIVGIHPTAIVAEDAILGKDVCLGPYVVIESKAVIGDKTIIHAGTFIGSRTKIGQDCLIFPNVTIRENIVIGDRVVIHSGAVIGSDGYGFEQVDGQHKKLAQIGIVVIEDDVEIGSNTTIDRARLDKTVIGRGTKIDNLVQIAHNVQIGENCIIVAQVGISGSAVIEKNCIFAGQSGVVGHVRIGEGSIITAQTGVLKSVPAFSKISGFPARPHFQFMKMFAHLQRFPRYIERIHELEDKIKALEAKLKDK